VLRKRNPDKAKVTRSQAELNAARRVSKKKVQGSEKGITKSINKIRLVLLFPLKRKVNIYRKCLKENK
jgi:hypothetical protein